MNQTEVTAIIPVRVDSEDRKKNIITCIEFLLKHHDCNIILKEVDVSQKLYPPENQRLKYIFEQCKEGEPFHRTKILNDMLCEVQTPYTINYDCDMLIPQSTMKKCLDMLKAGYDLVYPYPKGNVYFIFDLNDKQRRYFINDSNTNYMDHLFEKYAISLNQNNLWFFIDTELDGVVCAGGMQFFNTESYKKGFGENELFVDWGPEDYERIFRFYTLGYKIGWVDSGNILHMNHKKTDAAEDSSVLRKTNTKIWHQILMRRRKKEDMLDFMKSLEYTKKRNFI